MDPKIAILGAVVAFLNGELSECAESLASYQGWRRMGGFTPNLSDHVWSDDNRIALGRFMDERGMKRTDADDIADRLARDLRMALREKTGRDFGTRYYLDTLDAIDDALVVALVDNEEDACLGPNEGGAENGPPSHIAPCCAKHFPDISNDSTTDGDAYLTERGVRRAPSRS